MQHLLTLVQHTHRGRRCAIVRRGRHPGAGTGRRTVHAGWSRRFRPPAIHRVRADLLRFLLDAAAAGATIVGYGAPGTGNTMLNYCGIRTDLLHYTVDRNPYKHGQLTPGTRIPVVAPERSPRTARTLYWCCRGTCARSSPRSYPTWPTEAADSSFPSLAWRLSAMKLEG